MDISEFNSNSNWVGWFLSLRLKKIELTCLEAVVQTALWAIWSFRNKTPFKLSKPKKGTLWDNIVTLLFFWVTNMSRKFSIDWVGWLQFPIIAISYM